MERREIEVCHKTLGHEGEVRGVESERGLGSEEEEGRKGGGWLWNRSLKSEPFYKTPNLSVLKFVGSW